MKRIFTTLVTTLVFILPGFSQQPGELDPSWAGTGIMQMDVSGSTETSHGIVVQPDKKVVVAMAADFDPSALAFDFTVMRFLEDGTVDSSFAIDGVFHYENTNGSDIPYDLLMLEDGSFLVTGSWALTANNTEFMVIKLDPDGALDTTFAMGGVAIQPIDSGQDYARDIAVDADGNLVVCGFSYVPGFNFRRNVVCRLTANGALDTTFGNNGIFIWNDNQTTNELYNVAVAPDGGILASGYTKPSSKDRPSLYKILPDGSGLDSLFGLNGEIELPPVEGKANGMAIHPNGNILLGGYSFNNSTGSNAAVLAYNMDGTPNLSFGVDGIAEADAATLDYGLDLCLQSDGKILVTGEAGSGFQGPPRRFLTVRWDASGLIDPTWGTNGIVETPTSTIFAFSNAVTVQPHDGKVLITGATATTTSGNDLTIVRFGNFVDADGDGFALGTECDDSNAAVNPDADELAYNGLDDDCDPATPDDDLDGDGFVMADDCDDNNAALNPDATEVPYNGFDDDCNTATPDDDLDGDGFVMADDCDDDNADINPDAMDIPNNGVDEDCDGEDLVVGVHESAISKQFILYPNPAGDVVFIAFDANTPVPGLIRITDCAGKTLRIISQDFTNRSSISLGDLPKGLLILTIHTAEGVAVKRLIKQ